MGKSELVEEIKARHPDYAKAHIDTVVNELLNILDETLQKEYDKVVITGFGTFYVVNKAAYMARNPATGEQVEVPEKLHIKFRPGKLLQR